MKKRVLWLIVLSASLVGCNRTYIESFFTTGNEVKAELVNKVKGLAKTGDKWQISYTLDLESEGLRVEGKVRIHRDSLIWLNVKKLGIEAMRLKLTRDSVWILDRLKNKYFEGSYAAFEKFSKVPLDFELCQSIFLVEPYLQLVKEDNLVKSDSLMSFRDMLVKPNGKLDIEQQYFVEPVYLKGFKFFSDATKTRASITYDYGKKLKIEGFRLESSNSAMKKAYFKIKEIEEKDKLSTRFKISKRYEKIRL